MKDSQVVAQLKEKYHVETGEEVLEQASVDHVIANRKEKIVLTIQADPNTGETTLNILAGSSCPIIEVSRALRSALEGIDRRVEESLKSREEELKAARRKLHELHQRNEHRRDDDDDSELIG
jgi:hypothetical protein